MPPPPRNQTGIFSWAESLSLRCRARDLQRDSWCEEITEAELVFFFLPYNLPLLSISPPPYLMSSRVVQSHQCCSQQCDLLYRSSLTFLLKWGAQSPPKPFSVSQLNNKSNYIEESPAFTLSVPGHLTSLSPVLAAPLMAASHTRTPLYACGPLFQCR